MIQFDKNQSYSIASLILWLMPLNAHAIDMEYYTYGGFDTVVGAFQRLALIFSDGNYATLFFVVTVLGILLGGIALFYRGMTGTPVSFSGWLLPLLVGVILFKALIIPTGTLHVYDPTRNENQAVGGVPDAIIVIAGLMNLFERSIVDVLDTGSAYPYANEAGGITYELIYRATSEFNDLDDFNVTRNIGRFFTDCSLVALKSNAYPVDENELKRGTSDLMQSLADMSSYTVSTVAYTAANPEGVTETCKNAWDNYIFPVLNDPVTFENAIRGVCGKAGFNVGSANQVTACKNLMSRAMQEYGVVGGSTVQFIRNTYLAQAIDRAMQSANPDLAQRAIANRNLMVQGIGISNTVNDWLPSMRGVVLALALGMIPVLALFVVTPMMTKAVVFTVGLICWIALWGVTDAIVHQMAVDGAQTFFEQAKRFQFGLDAIWLSPEASTKALALFGKVRSMGVMMSTVLAFALYRFGGYAFANIAESLSQQLQAAGVESGRQAATPEGRAHVQDEMSSSIGTHANRAMHGLAHTANAATIQKSRDTAYGSQLHDQLSSGGATSNSLSHNIQSLSGMNVGDSVGALEGVSGMARYITGKSEVEPQDVTNISRNMARVESSLRAGETDKTRELMKSFSPEGNLSEGAAKYATIKALSQYKGLEKTGDLMERIQSLNPNMNRNDAAYQLASYELASKEGAINATEAQVQELSDFYQDRTRWDISEWQGIKEISDRFDGMTMSSLANASGKMRAYIATGNEAAIEHLSHEEMAAAATYNALSGNLSSAAKEQVMNSYADHNERSLPDAMRDASIFNSTREMAQFLGMAEWANKSGGNLIEMSMENYGGQMSLKIDSKDEWEQQANFLRKHDRWNPDMDRLVEGSGYNAVMDVSYDPNSSVPLSVSVKSGDDTRVSQTVTQDQRHQVLGNTVIDAGANMLIRNDPDQAYSGELPRIMQVADRDKQIDGQYDDPRVIGLLNGLSEEISQFGSTTDSHSETGRKSAAMNGGITIPKSLSSILPIEGGASLSAQAFAENAENQSFNTSMFIAEKILDQSLSDSKEQMQSNHNELIEGTPSYMQLMSSISANRYSELSESVMTEFKKMGVDKREDDNELMKEVSLK